MIPGTQGYEEEADSLAVRYETFSFEQSHANVAHLFPAPPATVADIGAGTGRDAAELARRGYAVTAVEPTSALRLHGQRLHSDVSIQWIDDHLPELTTLKRRGKRFDLVFLTAVWMHLDEAERRAAMPNLAAITDKGGTLIMAVRHGPIPAGRRMFEISDNEIVAQAAQSKFKLIFSDRNKDIQNRPGVHWSRLAFVKDAD